jgi:hypothetical protein
MKKTISFLLIGALIFSLVLPSLAEIDNSTINYLKAQTPDPWITMALISAGETDLDLNHLKEVSGNLATDYEKTILALTGAGENPRTFGNIDFIAQLKTFHQNNQIGSPDLLNDDFWGILALVSAGESVSDQIIQDSKNFILSNQNEDGGWSYSVGGVSDTNDTAVAIMALLEAKVSSTDPVISEAVEYLKLIQNDDGGFPYQAGSESDSGSDSWVISAIYRLNQDPYEWEKNDQNPVDHLKSLQRTDGSFKWIASEDKDYPVLTAYAVVALAQNYYPINRLHHLRIEGENNNICSAFIKATTALDIIENGAEICGYTYLIEETSWGLYLKKINDEEAYDLIGWLYFVNYEIPTIGAADFFLEPGDEVLWYFGEWGRKPTKLTLTNQKIDPGENVKAKVEYFEDSEWKPLVEAMVFADLQTFTTDNNGEADLAIDVPGTYQVYAEKSGYIRANQVSLSVGEGTSQNVGLRVEITQPTPPVPEIAFVINKSQIDFGQLAPGTQTDDFLVITNTGNARIYVEGIVSGNKIFRENITLDGLDWHEFSTTVNTGLGKDVLIGLTVPSDWMDAGIKEGDLTFWAITNQ